MTEDQAWIIGEFSATYADINPDLGYTSNPTPTAAIASESVSLLCIRFLPSTLPSLAGTRAHSEC